MEVNYVATFKATKEVVWLKKFFMGLGVVPLFVSPMNLFCDNKEMVAYSK